MKIIISKTFLNKNPINAIIFIKDANSFVFFKNNQEHNSKAAAAYNTFGYKKWWVFKNTVIGTNDSFTNKTWKRKVKQLKREEKLKVFK